MADTWECGASNWLEVYVDIYSNAKMARSVDSDLPHVIGDVYYSIIWVQLSDIATDSGSVLVNINISEWTWNDVDPCVVFISDVVIQVGGYSEFSTVNTSYTGNPNCHKTSGDNLDRTWRVYCDSAIYSSQLAQFHICDYADHTGPPPGPGPSDDPLLAAQYFDTTTFGWTGGCITQCITDNPLVGGGKNTVPTQVEWNLYTWDTDYSTTIDGTSLATSTVIIPSEELNNNFIWIPFYWNDLTPGKYMWSLRCIKGPHDGSFQLTYWDNISAQKWAAWINGVSHDNFYSKILGIETSETWEKIISIDDTFSNGTYAGINGCPNVKVKNGETYVPVLSEKDNYGIMRRNTGSVEAENLSFETGDLTDWTARDFGSGSITVSNAWSSDGTYSVKFYKPAWDGYSAYIHQIISSTPLISGWELMWDMYGYGTGTYKLEVTVDSTTVYDGTVSGEYFDVSGGIVSANSYIHIVVYYYTGEITKSKTIHIDNIRFVPPPDDLTAVGRVVGGASTINMV